jgi:hypothetical protein
MSVSRPTPPGRRTLAIAVMMSFAVHALLLGLLLLVPSWERPRDRVEVDGVTLEEETLRLESDPASKIAPEDVQIVYPVALNPIPSLIDHPRPETASTDPKTPFTGAPTHHDAAPGGDGPPGKRGGEGQRFFPSAGAGGSVVFVLDRSLSMGMNGALNAARRALLDTLTRLPATVRFQIVAYNRRASVLLSQQSDLVTRNDASLDEAVRALQELEPVGITDHVQALRRALAFRPDVVYLVTDAEQLSAAEVDAIGRLNVQLTKSHTAIHTIELRPGQERGDAPLRRVALLNHGTYRRLTPTP